MANCWHLVREKKPYGYNKTENGKRVYFYDYQVECDFNWLDNCKEK